MSWDSDIRRVSNDPGKMENATISIAARRIEIDDSLVLDLPLAWPLGVWLWKVEGNSENIEVGESSCEKSYKVLLRRAFVSSYPHAERLKDGQTHGPCPIVAVESFADLRRDVGQEESPETKGSDSVL